MIQQAHRIFVVFVLCIIFSRGAPLDQAFAGPALQEVQVIRVHDGDTVTLMVQGRICKSRLIGIDAPEMGQRPWGRRAKEHLIHILNQAGRTVLEETDVVQHDKYDRSLVYLRTKSGELINERMVLDGYAVQFAISPNVKYADKFAQAERRARQEQRGIWGFKGLKEMPFTYREKHPRK